MLKAAKEGTRLHTLFAEADRSSAIGADWNFLVPKLEGDRKPKSEGLSVNRDLGDGRRPDLVLWKEYDDQTKPKTEKQGIVLVVDYYTGNKMDVQGGGGWESYEHNQKGFDYKTCPEIKEKIDQGYEYKYLGVNPNVEYFH